MVAARLGHATKPRDGGAIAGNGDTKGGDDDTPQAAAPIEAVLMARKPVQPRASRGCGAPCDRDASGHKAPGRPRSCPS